MNDTNESFARKELLEFEQQLMALRPQQADSLTAETFYRAGWEAATQQAEATSDAVVVPSTRRTGKTSALTTHPRHRFMAGMLCGLAVGLIGVIGATATQWIPQDSQSSDSIATSAATADQEVDVKEHGGEVIVHSTDVEAVPSAPASMSDEDRVPSEQQYVAVNVLPWNWGPQVIKEVPVDAATLPLSPLARQSWGSVILSDSNAMAGAGDTTSGMSHVEGLTPFSSNRFQLEDLL